MPMPEWGKPFKCRLQKNGMFDADYTVYSEDDEKWMLVDAVGGMWDAGYTYFLKHRAKGQVDAEGKPTSTTLGAVDVKCQWDAFSFKVSGASRDVDCGMFYDKWDGDYDWGISSEKKLWAVWTYSKRAVIYSDPEMTKQIGWLDITGYAVQGSNPRLADARRVNSRLMSRRRTNRRLLLTRLSLALDRSGTWYQEKEERYIRDTDEDGRDTSHWETEWHQHCQTQGFQYKFNVFNTPMAIDYDRSGGGLFTASQHGPKCSLGSAPALLLRLLRARLVALGRAQRSHGERSAHQVPSHCPGYSSSPPPMSLISLRSTPRRSSRWRMPPVRSLSTWPRTTRCVRC